MLILRKREHFMKDDMENKILEILKRTESAEIDAIAHELFVSPSTVRRKLTGLQQKGLVIRTHGGAKLNDEHNFFPSFTLRTHQNSLEKKQIALAAISLIKNGDLIFLDGTTSAFFIAEYLSEFKNIKVVTNGIDTLSLLSRNGIDAYSTGGFVEHANRSVLVGHHAVDMIQKLHADIAFYSARSVGRDGEVYDCFEEENVVRACMMRHATKNVFLCDSTKFGRTSSYHLCALGAFDCVVSDRDIRGYFETEELPELIYR